jgi:WD40-like Beta Propeller Repeat
VGAGRDAWRRADRGSSRVGAPWRQAPLPPETRTEIVTPATDQPTMFALSPDGRQIVFVASGEGAPRLWLQDDVAPDGRFLINTVLGDAASPITLLMNWHPEVKK